MISADAKADKNNKKQKICQLASQLYLTNFYKKFLQNLKHNVKRACTFHLVLVGILSILIFSVKNRIGIGRLLNGQNPLSVTKVICRQSLSVHQSSVCSWRHIISLWLVEFIFSKRSRNKRITFKCTYSIVTPTIAGNASSKNCSDHKAFWKFYNILQKYL